MKQRFLALMFGLVVSFLLVEVMLRLFQPFSFRVRGNEIVLAANVEFSVRNASHTKLDQRVVHTKNSLGFRGDEPPPDWDKSITLITVGGSTTECYYLSDDKTWQAETGRRLADRLEGFWINNAGLDGHSTFGHEVLLRDYIANLKPDYVLLLVGINDVGRDDLSRFERGELAKRADGFLESLLKCSETVVLAHTLYRNFQAYEQGVSHRQIDFAQLPTVKVSEPKRRTILDAHRRLFLDGFRLRLQKLVSTCKQHEITPILMTQPLAIGTGIDQTTQADLAQIAYKDVNGDVGWAIMELYNDVTRAVAREQSVPLIDLAAKLEKNSELFYDFTHFTNAGARRVGGIVASELLPILNQLADPER